ncbi:MAG: hypothetical protein U9Q84_05715, partial [Thermodesulfobacteriota bacterium]|nr:hypothetical protein [Thermodesulfobacteriota bacterium]
MKKVFYFSLVVIISFCTLGMGGMGDGDQISVPEPEENYAVNLIDQSDVSIELEKFSCDGLTYIIGKLGRVEISIDFDKINSVFFLLQDKDVKAMVNLKDGKVVELVVDKKKPCYGVSSFADIRIEMQDIKRIT